MELNKIYNMDCGVGIRLIQENTIDCCVTSPPYYALRDYGCDGQIGLEETPEEYVRKLTDVFMEVHRVLKPEGTLWLNIGDSYATHASGSKSHSHNFKSSDVAEKNGIGTIKKTTASKMGLKEKDLIGIPWMLAFALRQSGWYLRQDIIWHKPNPMPESVKDRCVKAHEYIFLLSKSQKYYFDYEAIQEDATTMENRPAGVVRNRKLGYNSKPNRHPEAYLMNGMGNQCEVNADDMPTGKRNKRDVWSINTKPNNVAHFATFPQKLIAPCILAGCPNGGVVLDPFMGSGTTAEVARALGRKYIGFEISEEYTKLANKRLQDTKGLFDE